MPIAILPERRPQPQAEPADPPAPGFLEQVGEAARTQQDEAADAQAGRINTGYEDLATSLGDMGIDRQSLTRAQPWYQVPVPGGSLDPQKVWSAVQTARARDPTRFKGLPDTQQAYENWLIGRKGARIEDESALARGTGASATAAGLIGGAVAGAADSDLGPLQFSFGAGGASLLRSALTEGVMFGAQQAAKEPETIAGRQAFGEQTTPWQMAEDIFGAFAGGVVMVPAGHAAGGVLKGAWNLAGRGLDYTTDMGRSAFENAVANHWESLPQTLQDRWAARGSYAPGSPADDILHTDIAEHIIGPDKLSLPEKDSVNVLRREAEIQQGSPYPDTGAGIAQHSSRFAMAMSELSQLPKKIDPPPPAPMTAPVVTPGVADFETNWRAILRNEGGVDPATGKFITSPAGAIGPAQLEPATAEMAAKLAKLPWDDARFRSDPNYNVALGRAYYRDMLRQFDNDPIKAAAAYNAGPGSAKTGRGLRGAMARARDAGVPEQWERFLPAETQKYLRDFRSRTGVPAPGAPGAVAEAPAEAPGEAAPGEAAPGEAPGEVPGEAPPPAYPQTPEEIAEFGNRKIEITSKPPFPELLEQVREAKEAAGAPPGEGVPPPEEAPAVVPAEAAPAAVPPAEAAPLGEAGVERQGVVRIPEGDTRGQGVQYHGARGELPDLTEGYANPNNIYGGHETFYTTDAADIAGGYQRKKQAGMIYRADEVAPVKMFDMEGRQTPEKLAALFGEKWDRHATGFEFEAIARAMADDGKANLREVMDEMRDISSEYGYSKDDVQEIFDTAIHNLQQEGYGGMRHIGGLRTGREPHNVQIYFKAHDQLRLTPAEKARAAEAAPAPGEAARPEAPAKPPIGARAEDQGAAPTALPTAAGPIAMRQFHPDDIGVDAHLMQFKAGGDAQGVTPRLMGIQQWDPLRAGTVTVWEGLDGRRLIADGHQRLGLAKRLLEEDPTRDIKMNAFVLREKDGVTASEARSLTALKNIAEGSGTRIDAAKVFREVGEDPRIFEAMPKNDPLIRDGRNLAKLSDDAFRAVVNHVISDKDGAVIGELAPDKATHMGLVQVLHETDPANRTQARAIVKQALDAGFSSEHQDELFGGRTIVSSLFAQKAKLLDKTLGELKKLKGLFTVAARNAEALDAAGNRIDVTKSEAEAAGNAQALALVEKLALRKGNAVNDLFNRSAERLAAGEPFASVLRDTTASVRSLDLTSALEGADEPGAGLGTGGPDEQARGAGEAPEGPGGADEGDLGPSLFEQAEAAGQTGFGFEQASPSVEAASFQRAYNAFGDGKFADPVGPALQAQSEQLGHDMAALAPVDDRKFDFGDGSTRTIAQQFAHLDDEDAAIAALKDCL